MRFNIPENKVLKKGRQLFNVQTNDELLKIGGAFFANLATPPIEQVAGGLGTNVSNIVRRKMKSKYKIDNLRELTDKDGLTQLPYSNFIGPGTDLEDALEYGPVTAGPAAEKNANGLSADEIAKQHDLMYHNVDTGGFSDQDKFDMIQHADRWMIGEVETLPDSKTKRVILESLRAKYNLEKLRGKLFYGGKFRPLTREEFLQASIDAVISGTTAKLNKKIETREDRVAKNLEKLKKEKDEVKAALVEKNKPYSQADKSILNSNGPMWMYYEPVDYNKKTNKYHHVLTFPKDEKIKDEDRPPIEYVETAEVKDPSTGDTYVYSFPVYKTGDGKFRIDFMSDVTLVRDGKVYKTPDDESNLFTALKKLADDNVNFDDDEVEALKKHGFVDKDDYVRYQIENVEINRQALPGKPNLRQEKRIRVKAQTDESYEKTLVKKFKKMLGIMLDEEKYKSVDQAKLRDEFPKVWKEVDKVFDEAFPDTSSLYDLFELLFEKKEDGKRVLKRVTTLRKNAMLINLQIKKLWG